MHRNSVWYVQISSFFRLKIKTSLFFMTVSYHTKGKMFPFTWVCHYFYFPFAIANHMCYSLKENIIMSTPTVLRFFFIYFGFFSSWWERSNEKQRKNIVKTYFTPSKLRTRKVSSFRNRNRSYISFLNKNTSHPPWLKRNCKSLECISDLNLPYVRQS